MNFKTPFKVLTTAALVGALSLSAVAPGAASAAEKTSQSVKAKEAADYAISQYILTKTGAAPIVISADKYQELFVDSVVSGKSFSEILNGYSANAVVTAKGAVFTLEAYTEAFVDATVSGTDKETAALLEGLEKAGKATEKPADLAEAKVDEDGKLVEGEKVPSEETDFEVTEVAAITDTVKKATNQQLGFTVNGKAADLEKLKEAGYTVSYEYDKTALASYTDGKIDVTKVNGTSFEYRVVVTPKEGEAVTSEWTEVTIQDATKVTKVNKVALVKGESEWTQSVLDNQVSFKATEFENVLGEKNTDKDVTLATPAVVSAKSSDAAIAYYDTDLKTIKVLQDGEVTFDVKFEGVTETVPVTVKVVAGQSMKSIKADSQKVAANDATATAKLVVLDQNKEAFVGGTSTKVSVEIKKGTETAVAATDATVNGKGEVTVDAKNLAKGSYTVVVSTKDVTPVKLGEFSIEAVDIQGNPDTYTLSLPTEETKPEIDIKNDAATLDLNAKGTIQGIETALPNTADFKVIAKSSDTKVATAELDTATKKVTVKPTAEAKAGDTVKVQLYTKQGSKEVAVGNEITITIVNSTPQVKTMTLKKDTKVTFTKGDDASTLASKVIAAIVEGEEGSENQVKADMIDSVTYVASNEEVLVKVKTLNGGQTFKLAAIELGNKADLNQSITDAKGSTVKDVEAVKTAIAAAEKVQADTTATQKQVDAAKTALDKAVLTATNNATGVVTVAPASENTKLDTFLSGIVAKLATNKNVELTQDGTTLILKGEFAKLTDTGFWPENEQNDGNFVALKIAAPEGFKATKYKLGNGNGSDVDGDTYALVVQRLTGDTSKSLKITWTDAENVENEVTYTLNYSTATLAE